MLKVRDIMTRDVFTLAPESTIRDAMELLTANHLSGAPVMAGETVVGVVSMGDILGLLSAAPEPSFTEERIFVIQGIENVGDDSEDEDEANLLEGTEAEWDEWASTSEDADDTFAAHSGILDNRTVGEIMSPEVFSIAPGAPVNEAASMMGKHGIHRLVVTNHKSLAGIISALDIARAVSERGLAQKRSK
jgi:Predicted signal-transduction protein containing cAMP-binding and CBS domains